MRLTRAPQLREYQMLPSGAAGYVAATKDALPTRLLNLPLRSFTVPESGGPLLVATHSYYYPG